MSSIVVLNSFHTKIPLIVAMNKHSENKKLFSVETFPSSIIGTKTEGQEGSWLSINKSGIFSTFTGGNVEAEKINLKVLELSSLEEMVKYFSNDLKLDEAFPETNFVFGDHSAVYIASRLFDGFCVRKCPTGMTVIKDVFPLIYSGRSLENHRLFEYGDLGSSWNNYYAFLKEALRSKFLAEAPVAGLPLISSAVLSFSKTKFDRFKLVNRFEKPARYKDYFELYEGLIK